MLDKLPPFYKIGTDPEFLLIPEGSTRPLHAFNFMKRGPIHLRIHLRYDDSWQDDLDSPRIIATFFKEAKESICTSCPEKASCKQRHSTIFLSVATRGKYRRTKGITPCKNLHKRYKDLCKRGGFDPYFGEGGGGRIGLDVDTLGELRPKEAITPEEAVKNLAQLFSLFKDFYKVPKGTNIHAGGGKAWKYPLGAHIHISFKPYKKIKDKPLETFRTLEREYDNFGNIATLGLNRLTPAELLLHRLNLANQPLGLYLNLLDLFVGIPLKSMKGGERPDNHYGELGSYHTKRYGNGSIYGIEYRTPPSFITSPELYKAVLGTVKDITTNFNKNIEVAKYLRSKYLTSGGHGGNPLYNQLRTLPTQQDYIFAGVSEENAIQMVNLVANLDLSAPINLKAWQKV